MVEFFEPAVAFPGQRRPGRGLEAIGEPEELGGKMVDRIGPVVDRPVFGARL